MSNDLTASIVHIINSAGGTLPADVISQAHVLVVHRLTLLDDLKAVSRISSTYAWP